ncbi:hypothetical protein ABZW18_21300 [Streptomyces sp. NPDC004647]|uniref:hypothetical protein n=1 Tax=Streptomyces sp. NPDC004647 TaxID=3154671 RepID=UPI0033BD8D59
MSHRIEQPKLPPIAVHTETASNAQLRLASLLTSAGVSAGEAQHMVAAIQAGAVEAAQCEAIELDTPGPRGRGDQFEEGWLAAVQAVASRLAHIADRTLRQAPAATPDPPRPAGTTLPTAVESVDEAQVSWVLAVAEHIFRNLTGYTGYSREMSREILSVALLSVSAEDQAGYPQQLEAFAAQNRDRLTALYRKYGPGGELTELDRSGLAQQPESVVLCERIDTSPRWLEGVWDGELDESLLERFRNVWQYGIEK